MTNPSQRSEPAMSDGDFRIIQAALRQATGISLPDGKRPLVVSRLTRRIRSLKLNSFSEYSALISRADDGDELGNMISALTTNVTAFFRESHHFDTFRDSALPALIERARKGGKVRLWSAACSSGEEPYSLAMTLLDRHPEAKRLDFRILATDIDPAILEVARKGLYSAESVATVPIKMRERWFQSRPSGRDRLFQISPEIAQMVTFRRLNLAGAWPIRTLFDVIFCRNVAIYFDREVQDQLWARLAGQLAPGGYLCIGHSERISGPAAQLVTPKGITTYIRRQNEGTL